ncbi:MAG TPA: HEAT repeat domain-containing protein [Bryobacteraceae bacterium]|mgnify:CR=1 FL=1|nr:HEAT repeat domain-containing protein [Bryobacteraceae bacterium]HOQ45961.1 HEAT repeat domain-containing protein [Bryobacteraceae bacterium]HPQ15634.1 HEAT repeat domain-containing protein [Bryobacteraceae bacterium]HPU73220.1 HEAT repeat domain-containing protein [Bryobacteraceae bacterium]
MRILLLLALVAPSISLSQAPRIGVIDFYGVRRVSESRLREALGVKEGDALPPSKVDVEERLEQVPGVVRARLEAICCDQGRAILFVGIEERGAPSFLFRDPPAGDASLPEPIVRAYREYLVAIERAMRSGPVTENISQGHVLSNDAAARQIEERFVSLAAGHLDALRRALRESADPEQRAVAACVIGYAPDKRKVIDDLQYAMRDFDEGVRGEAIRSLGAIAALGDRKPDSGIRVEPTWFIQMLNSIVRSDRARAASALVALTEQRRPYVLDQIRHTAMESLAEMARWRPLEHALPAYLVLGRAAGIPEQEIQTAWTSDTREDLIERALKAGLKK